MFKLSVTELLHIGRNRKPGAIVKRAKLTQVRIVNVNALKMSKPLTKQEIADKYKEGRFAEMSDVHAGI